MQAPMQAPMHAHQPMIDHVKCCCCNARTGLRVLGFWWLFEMVANIYALFLPYFWIGASTVYIQYLVPFIVFC